MRATAEVGKGTLRIGRDGAVFELTDELYLILFAPIAKHFKGIGLGDIVPHNILFAGGQFQHLGFDGGKIALLYGRLARVDIVIESILNSGTDTKLDTGIELLQGFGHEVCRTVPESVLALGIVPLV